MKSLVLALLAGIAHGQHPHPRPDASPCERECAEHCSKVRPPKGTVGECDECVKKIPLGPKTDGNCTARQELSFCQPLRPVASSCMMHLERECGHDRMNISLCDKCVEKSVTPAFNCTPRQEREFCEIRPAPSFACERELMEECGKVRHDQDKCDLCVKKIPLGPKTDGNCTKREELTFCNATHPPAPGPVSKKCEEVLKKTCSADRKKGQRECDLCVKKAGAEEHCTIREEFSFCNASKPVEDRCEELLSEDCKKAKEEGPEACDRCAEKLHAAKPDLACTRRDVIAYCGALPPQPGPITDQCHMTLKKDCPTKPELLCDKCAEKKGPMANCSKREEMSYCDDSPRPQPPTPAECTEHLKARCNKPGEDCASCAKKLGTEHNCTAASEKAACAK